MAAPERKQSSMRKFLATAAIFAALSGLTACGGDDGGSTASAPKLSGDEQKASDALLASFDEGDDFPGSQAEKECVAAKVVKSVGAERSMKLAETDGDDLEEADAKKVVEAMTSCMDLGKLIVDEITAGGEISEKSATCLAKAFDNDFVSRMMMAEFTGADSEMDADGMKKVLDAMSKCLTAEELKTSGLG